MVCEDSSIPLFKKIIKYQRKMETDKIYCGDSEELLGRIDDESIDLIVTSPPYDNLRSYGGTCGWNKSKFEAIARELARVLKDGGVLIWNVSDKTENGGKTGTSMRQALFFMDECGLKLNDYMFWRKKNPMPQVRQPRYTNRIEFMFCFSKGKPKTFNPIMIPCKSAGKHYQSTAKIMGGERGRRDLDYNVNQEMVDYQDWDIAVAQNRRVFKNENGEEIRHPAVFPIELPLRHIRTWTNEGDVVLDPFMGSGTTALAAMELNRHYIGLEQNQDYVDIANTLISEALVPSLAS